MALGDNYLPSELERTHQFCLSPESEQALRSLHRHRFDIRNDSGGIDIRTHSPYEYALPGDLGFIYPCVNSRRELLIVHREDYFSAWRELIRIISHREIYAPKQIQDTAFYEPLQRILRLPVQHFLGRHGYRTRCVFCQRVLTHPESQSLGYGPVCAFNRNIPWGGVYFTSRPRRTEC